jgi:hypothetical protein
VYVKRGGGSKCIHFWSVTGQWIVAPTENKGKNDYGWAFLKHRGRLEAASSMSDWRGSNGKTQGDVRVHVESAPVHIRGATGIASSEVNGIFDPTEELSCGQPVYVKRGDGSKCIHYWSAHFWSGTGDWIVTDTASKGKNGNGWAFLTHSGRLEAASSMSDWTVSDGKAVVAQADVRVHVESAPVHIRGATGHGSSEVNGIFDPTEELSCGQPVYVKRGDGIKCMHFWSATGQWTVAPTENKGKNDAGWACLKHSGRLEAASSMSDWRVGNGKEMITQADVRVHVESAPVHIRGAKGPSSAEVNGIFDPTEELSCGQPVYVKRGDGIKCMHFWSATVQWIVTPTENKGKNGNGWAFLKHSGRLEAASLMSDWKVYDGKAFVTQADVRVHVESAPVHIRGYTRQH